MPGKLGLDRLINKTLPSVGCEQFLAPRQPLPVKNVNQPCHCLDSQPTGRSGAQQTPEHKIPNGRAVDPDARSPVAVGVTVCGFFSFQLAPSSESFRLSPQLPAQPALVGDRQVRWFTESIIPSSSSSSSSKPQKHPSNLSSLEPGATHTHTHTHHIPRYIYQPKVIPGRGPLQSYTGCRLLVLCCNLFFPASHSFSSLALSCPFLSCLVHSPVEPQFEPSPSFHPPMCLSALSSAVCFRPMVAAPSNHLPPLLLARSLPPSAALDCLGVEDETCEQDDNVRL